MPGIPSREPSRKRPPKKSSLNTGSNIPAQSQDNAPAATTPTPEEIARLAYSYWLARGEGSGSAEDDWLRAEQELSGVVKPSESPTEETPKTHAVAS